VDIFDLFQNDQTQQPARAPLPVLSLWRQATLYLMFFTLTPARFRSHYDEAGRCAYHCLEADCPACAAGVRATDHVYLPVWDVQNRRVAVLKFHTAEDGPAEKILGFLQSYRQQLAEVVAVLECAGRGQFTIIAHQPLPETDRGALACEEFARGLESGAVSLRACARQLTAEEIARLPGVKGRGAPVIGAAVAPAAPARVAAGAVVGKPVPTTPPGAEG
jgi:hypothetical protein